MSKRWKVEHNICGTVETLSGDGYPIEVDQSPFAEACVSVGYRGLRPEWSCGYTRRRDAMRGIRRALKLMYKQARGDMLPRVNRATFALAAAEAHRKNHGTH